MLWLAANRLRIALKEKVKIHHICFQFGEMVKKRMDILERIRLIGMLS